MPLKDKIDLALKAVGLLAVFLGLAQFVDKLYEREQQFRRQESAALVKEYLAELAPLELRIRIMLLPYVSAFNGPAGFNDPKAVSDAEVENVYRALYLSGLSPDTAPRLGDLLKILAFYDRVNACIETSLCDSEYIVVALCDAAKQFHSYQVRLIQSHKRLTNETHVDTGLTGTVDLCEN